MLHHVVDVPQSGGLALFACAAALAYTIATPEVPECLVSLAYQVRQIQAFAGKVTLQAHLPLQTAQGYSS